MQAIDMHLYSCGECCVTFAVEDHESIDHSDVVCPICKRDENLEDAASGSMSITRLPETE